MTDTRTLLRSLEPKMTEPGFDLEAVLKRQHRVQRRKRVEAGVLGLGLTVALVGGLVAVNRGPAVTRAANGDISTLPPATITVPTVVAGQYSYVRSYVDQAMNINYGPIAVNFATDRESVWWGPDGSGRFVSTISDGVDRTYGPNAFPTDVEKPGLAALPTDPAALRHYLLGGDAFSGSPVAQASASPGQTPESVEVTRIVADLMLYPSSTPLSPAQRVALMDLLSSYKGDGVSVDLHSTDPAGRPAYLLSCETTSGPTTYDYYVDPASHDLLAMIERIPRSGQVEFARVVESAGIAPNTTDTPTSGWIDPGTSINIDTSAPAAFVRKAAAEP